MAEPQEPVFVEASVQWLEAAAWIGLTLRISGGTDVRWGAYHYLNQMSRFQFACELSFHRVGEASKLSSSEDHPTAMTGIGCLYLDIHSFLVSAHAYWRTLTKLNTIINLTELDAAISNYQRIADETKIARDHLEHIVERIEIGRPPRFGQHMTAQTFRGSMGRFDGSQVAFGDETFNLGAINEAIRNVGRTVAPVLCQAVSPNITVKVTEPKGDDSV